MLGGGSGEIFVDEKLVKAWPPAPKGKRIDSSASRILEFEVAGKPAILKAKAIRITGFYDLFVDGEKAERVK